MGTGMTQWTELNTEGKTALIIKVWKPHFSASKIAQALGKHLSGPAPSRSAIVGFYTRVKVLSQEHPLGGAVCKPYLGHRKNQTYKKERRKAGNPDAISLPPDAPRVPVTLTRRPENLAYDRDSRHLLLKELSAFQCHWPVNDPAPGEDHLFCGHAGEEGKRYCSHHLGRLFYRGPVIRRKTPEPVRINEFDHNFS
jgi:hypothetical protein